MANLGAAIKEFRKKANLTQDQLADKLGTTKAAISRYESGKRTPRYDQIIQIAEALQISPNLLIGYEIHNLDDCSYAIIDGDRVDPCVASQLTNHSLEGGEAVIFLKNEADRESFFQLMHNGTAYPDNLKQLLEAFNRLNYIGQKMVIHHAESLLEYPDSFAITESDKSTP